jgi:endonuclease G
VIAFIHDDTGQLSATGYTISQSSFISEDEFVFGQHKTAQCTIASIEQRAGLSFGDLSRHDPFVEPEGIEPELTDVRQIPVRLARYSLKPRPLERVGVSRAHCISHRSAAPH